jgi:hypothetical protein
MMVIKKLLPCIPTLWGHLKNYNIKKNLMSWGNKLLVAFLVFGLMIGYLVFRAVNTNFEIVEKDYYKKELRYQQVIDGNIRANGLASQIQVSEPGNGVSLQFPVELNGKLISGNILFYCSYDKSNDRKFEIRTNNIGLQTLSKEVIIPGNYIVKIDWACDGKNYYSEKNFTVH